MAVCMCAHTRERMDCLGSFIFLNICRANGFFLCSSILVPIQTDWLSTWTEVSVRLAISRVVRGGFSRKGAMFAVSHTQVMSKTEFGGWAAGRFDPLGISDSGINTSRR